MKERGRNEGWGRQRENGVREGDKTRERKRRREGEGYWTMLDYKGDLLWRNVTGVQCDGGVERGRGGEGRRGRGKERREEEKHSLPHSLPHFLSPSLPPSLSP